MLEIGQAPDPSDAERDNGDNKYRQIFRLKEVHLLALFILIYVGVEVTLGGEYVCSWPERVYNRSWFMCTGWTVTYIIKVRGGGSSSGYVSSGFFGGIFATIARVLVLN